MVARLVDRSFSHWADAAASVGYCANPIRISGESTTYDRATGEPVAHFNSTDAPLGVLHVPCGNRREHRCPACSRVYGRDTYELISTGLNGGKTVPESVADNPLLFATFTAPSFGHVHRGPKKGQPAGRRCRPRDKTKICPHGRPIGCMKIHAADDPANGSPICWDCYDWNTAVVWQWWAPELWRRTTIALRRCVAAALGVSERKLSQHASVQYAKVAEYQARGAVHFHALFRLDGPTGPKDPQGAPSPMIAQAFAECVREAAASVSYRALRVDPRDTVRHLSWGEQLDIRTVRDGNRTDDPDGPLTPEQVAGYIAKYATKDAASRVDPDHAPAHLRRLKQTCLDLDARHRVHHGVNISTAPYALLGKWAGALGFRGHFSTKSRRYSVTLGRLRRARQRFQRLMADAARKGEELDTRDLEARLMADDAEETTLVVGQWAYQGTGWTSPGDEALALAAAARAREYDHWRATQPHTA